MRVPDPNYIYNGLGDRERVLLPHFWRRLRDTYWEDDFENPKLNLYNPQLVSFRQKSYDSASISSVSTDASTKPLLDLPLRTKENKVTVENIKDEYDINAQPGPSTEAKETPKNSAPKVLENFLQHMGHKSLDDYKSYRAAPLTDISHPDIGTSSALLSKDTPNFTFANTSTPFAANSSPYQLSEPPHNFKFCCFLDELKSYTDHICHSMLSKPDGSENNMLTDTLLCLTDKEWQYLPLWAGGNDDGSGGVTSADVPPAYYANVGGLTPGVMYKGASGFVGTETEIGAGSQVGSQTGTVWDDDGESNTGSVFSTGSYDMAAMTPTGSGSESDFEIVSSGEDEGDSEREMSDGEFDEEDRENEKGKGKGKGKEIKDEMMDENEDGGEDDMDWTNQEDSEVEDDWERSFTDL
ncbi:uncharacterized protein EAF02_009975 [Botrytis sinoallii]|uniref:uncharacterized protein n=1 Tax=Botrytis sinoallii TaxID=1463999 RepID=UPI0019003CCB|nr:uncharacterized protein EAF02_009975 [Botrytis sinoallii]KAF7865552.1 hypothetical protein EAF02_009975 [Botrytis sinoallii]